MSDNDTGNISGNGECLDFSPVIMIEGLARAYVANQYFCDIYDEETSLMRGTVFPALDKPYVPFNMRLEREARDE